MDLLDTSTESLKINLKSSEGVGANQLPRLNIQIEDPEAFWALKRQLAEEEKTQKAWVNELLELVLLGPAVVKDRAIDDVACMLEIFRNLPMDKIREFGKRTHRNPEQVIKYLIEKGLEREPD